MDSLYRTEQIETQDENESRFGFTARLRAIIAGVLCVTIITPTVCAGILTADQTQTVNQAQADAAKELSRLNTTGRPTVGNVGNSSQSQVNIGEIVPGASMDTSALEGAWDDPKSTQDITKKSRTFIQMNGCRQSTFKFLGTQVVATYQAFQGTGTSATPIPYSGAITPYGALGGERSAEVPINSAANTWLRIHLTPFPYPTDHTYVVGDFGIRDAFGAGTFSFDTYTGAGVAGEGFIPRVKSLNVTNGNLIQITASLWKVNREYTAKPASGVCQPDPLAGTCKFDGYDVCDPYNQEEVAKLFAVDAAPSLNAVTDSFDVVRKSLTKARPTKSDVLQMVNASKSVLNGTAGDVLSLFQGCQVDTRYSSSVSTVHLKDPRSCSNYRVGSDACSADKRFQLVLLQSNARVGTITQYEGATQVKVTNSFTFDFPTMSTPSARDQDIGPVMINVLNPTTNLMETKPKGYWVQAPAIPPATESLWSYVETGERITRHLDLTPFVLKPNEYVVGGMGAIDATLTLSSVGSPSNSWTPSAVVTPIGTSNIAYVTADVYQVVLNEIAGCDDQRALAPAAGEIRPFCQMNTTCTAPVSDCASSNGLTFCASSGPLSGIFELYPKWGGVWDESSKGQCQSIHVDANSTCSIQDVSDPAVWQTNIGDKLSDGHQWKDNCADQGLFNNQQCSLINFGTCQDGAKGKDGTCYGYSITYDCGKSTTVTTGTSSPGETSCLTAVRCMGDECRNVKSESNNSFSKAAAAGQVVEMMQHDFKCQETNDKPQAGVGCTPEVFNGRPLDCRTSIGASTTLVPDCCKQAQDIANGTDFIGWLTVAVQTWKLANTPMVANALANMGVSSGWLKAIQNPVSLVSQPLMSGLATMGEDLGWQGLTDFAEDQLADEAMTNGSEGVVSAFEQKMLNYARDFLVENYPELALDMFGSTAATDGTAAVLQGTAKEAVDVLSGLMTVYSIYSIAKLVGHLLYTCTEKENQLGVGIGTKSCTLIKGPNGEGDYCSSKRTGIGCVERKKSYCCYSSPLARIIMEQARAQLGGFGSQQSPNCQGLSPSELAGLNWNAIDLSEWVGILQEQGLLPKGAVEAENMYGMNANWAKVKGVTSGVSLGPDGLASTKDMVNARLGDKAGMFDNGREQLAGQRVCFDKQNPARGQWYESAPVSPQDIIRPIGGTGSVMNCSTTDPNQGCVEIYLGLVGDNYLAGNNCATSYDKYFSMYVKRPDLISSATLMEAQWDDHLNVEISGATAFKSDGYDNVGGATPCELSQHWCLGPDANITSGSAAACSAVKRYNTVDLTSLYKAGGKIDTKTSVKVGGMGEGFARVRIIYDRTTTPNNTQIDCYVPGS